MIVAHGTHFGQDGVSPSIMVGLTGDDIARIVACGEILIMPASELSGQTAVFFAPTNEIAVEMLNRAGMVAPDAKRTNYGEGS